MDHVYSRSKIGAYRRATIAAAQAWRCGACEQLLPAEYEVDHRLPLFAGGSNHDSNLQALCPNCHARKSRREQPVSKHLVRRVGASAGQCARCKRVISLYFLEQHRCAMPA